MRMYCFVLRAIGQLQTCVPFLFPAAACCGCLLCSGQYVLTLCNAIGTPIDSKYIDIEPVYLAMTPTHVVAASNECCFVWHYKQSRALDSKASKKRDEKVCSCSHTPVPLSVPSTHLSPLATHHPQLLSPWVALCIIRS